jgi:putative nucleotidyltransferase-like protein
MDGARFRRENALLHAAARLPADTAALSPNVLLDWSYIQRAAARQGITPLLHLALQSLGHAVPPTVRANLHAAYWQNHFRNRTLLEELTRILDAADAARVEAMPLKGAVLAPFYYPAAALRPLSDLDFMIRPGDAERFATVLRGLGYQQGFVRPPLDPRMGRSPLREWMFVRHAPEMTIVVEYRIEPLDPALGTLLACDPALVRRLLRHAGGIWTRARAEACGGASFRRIAPEDLLLHVASHLTTRHAGYRLLWLHDLCRIAAAHPNALDWAFVAAEARALRLHTPVFAALEAAHDRLGAPFPLDTLRPLFFGGSRRFPAARIERALLASPRAAHPDVDLAQEPPLQWWLLAGSLLRVRGIRPALRAIRWTALPSRVYIAAWRSRPDDSSLRGHLSGVLLRIGLGAVSMIGAISRRAKATGLAAWCDRILRRARPFAIYRPEDDAGIR